MNTVYLEAIDVLKRTTSEHLATLTGVIKTKILTHLLMVRDSTRTWLFDPKVYLENYWAEITKDEDTATFILDNTIRFRLLFVNKHTNRAVNGDNNERQLISHIALSLRSVIDVNATNIDDEPIYAEDISSRTIDVVDELEVTMERNPWLMVMLLCLLHHHELFGDFINE